MEPFFNFDEVFGGFRELMKSMRSLDDVEKAVESGSLKGQWNVEQIDEPGVKGYIIRGSLWSDQPIEPYNPFERPTPLDRRPVPERPFRVKENALKATREPFADVFEKEKALKIYIELPGEEKEDIQLNVAEGKVEVKTKNFYKMMDIPRDIEVEKASSKYNNGVLEVTIPKREKPPEGEKLKIKIA